MENDPQLGFFYVYGKGQAFSFFLARAGGSVSMKLFIMLCMFLWTRHLYYYFDRLTRNRQTV